MRIRPLVAIGAASLVAGCADGRGPLEPPSPSLASASASRQVDASGAFAANVDFTTLRLTPRGRNCLLEVDGQLVFTGDIAGTATGTTTALVFATCEEALATPPGTHPDVFKSELAFTGTIGGEPATASLLYMGRVRPGGTIEGRLVFSNGASGKLDADAVVAVGGTYQGSVVVH